MFWKKHDQSKAGAQGTRGADTSIFISYSREDRTRVERLVKELRRRLQVDVWFDNRITPGASYQKEIAAALKSAKLVIVCWSADSIASEFVQDEASRAKSADKLLPVRIDDVEVPLGFGLRQTIDVLFTGGTPPEPGMTYLVNEVMRRFPERLWGAVFGPGNSVTPIIKLPRDRLDKANFISGYVSQTPLALCIHGHNERSALMPLQISLSLLGFSVSIADSDGEYDKGWHDLITEALGAAAVVLMPWFPTRASDGYHSTLFNVIGAKPTLHLAVGGAKIEDAKKRAARFRVSSRKEDYYQLQAAALPLSGAHVKQTWTFVEKIMRLAPTSNRSGV